MFNFFFSKSTVNLDKGNNYKSWNPLHHLAYSANVSKLKQGINQLGGKAKCYAKQCTHDGSLPIDLLEKNPHFKKQEKELRALLEPLTEGEPLIPLTKKLNASDIHKLYPHLKPKQKLYRNLKAAYVIINEVRNHITISTTHTDYNNLSPAEKKSWKKTLNEMRTFREEQEAKIKSSHSLITYADAVLKYKTGNCGEAAHLGLYLLQQSYPSLKAELYEYENADHVFLVIDRDTAINPNNYRLWGKNAVICDPWAGCAMTVDEIPQKLKYYFNYEAADKNYAIPFDPRYHKLQAYPYSPPKKNEMKKNDRFFKKANVLPESKPCVPRVR